MKINISDAEKIFFSHIYGFVYNILLHLTVFVIDLLSLRFSQNHKSREFLNTVQWSNGDRNEFANCSATMPLGCKCLEIRVQYTMQYVSVYISIT
jgi:hypothetical protein